MKGHVKAKHEGLKPFECSVEACGKAFGYKHALARHNRTIHENPTPRKKRVPERTVVDLITGADYACNQARRLKCSGRDCNAAFKRKYDLDRHLRSVHSDHLSENAARIAGAGPPPAPVAEGAFATVGDPVAAGTVAVDPTAA
ncbi:MAG: hypothetical protein BJ554DRAFT_2606 [Olpidium bornovanus]|uniref:C2H2-type domain-containing protein n=1 Tax=Olpidium bornovanus TaxID=278681 RepID=A0A8H7ZQK0_9FUNG|nr:MAG: hypothetical protein BJ554DRAFT_2606 [Olpidium bornovanus]